MKTGAPPLSKKTHQLAELSEIIGHLNLTFLPSNSVSFRHLSDRGCA